MPARYDRLNRGTEKLVNERQFETLTLGLTYRVNKHVRVLADYQFHDALAPALPDNDVANRNLDEFDSLPALRVWVRYL